jgi:hypothetical protein
MTTEKMRDLDLLGMFDCFYVSFSLICRTALLCGAFRQLLVVGDIVEIVKGQKREK